MSIEISEISRRLAEQAERVCQKLLPGGRQVKMEWVCGSIHGGEGNSLHVHIAGDHAGCWKDWATNEHGDLIDLWRVTGCLTAGEAVRQIKDWLGIVDPVKRPPKSYKPAPQKESTPPNPAGRSFAWLTGIRKILPETMEAFKVETDPKVGTIIFPCYNPSGEIENRSYRTLPKDGGKKKVWQEAGCAPCLFGWQAVPVEAIQRREILIAEGQIDAMTWHQWGFPALSIPSGTSPAWIDHEWDNLTVFSRILLSFDMDGAGRENAQNTAARLGIHRCLFVKIPGKDANECLQNGCSAEEAARWVADATAPPLNGLVRGCDMEARLRAELLPKPEPFTLKLFRIRWPHEGFYFRPGEVTLWTGASFHGKSTFLNFVMMTALSQRIPVFMASMESRVETILRRLAVTTYARTGCRVELTPDCAADFLFEFGDHLTFADVVGFISQEKLLEMMRYSFQRFGARHFIVDSLMRVEGLEEDFPAQGTFMNVLQEFAKQSGAHVHLVAHPRKLNSNGKPSMMDIKGSSLIPNNADNILAVVRNMEKMEAAKDGSMTPAMQLEHDTEIIIEKQRESGWIGSFLLHFDSQTYNYTPKEKGLLALPAPRRETA